MLHAELRLHRDNSKPQHFTLMGLKRNVVKLQCSKLHYWEGSEDFCLLIGLKDAWSFNN